MKPRTFILWNHHGLARLCVRQSLVGELRADVEVSRRGLQTESWEASSIWVFQLCGVNAWGVVAKELERDMAILCRRAKPIGGIFGLVVDLDFEAIEPLGMSWRSCHSLDKVSHQEEAIFEAGLAVVHKQDAEPRWLAGGGPQHAEIAEVIDITRHGGVAAVLRSKECRKEGLQIIQLGDARIGLKGPGSDRGGAKSIGLKLSILAKGHRSESHDHLLFLTLDNARRRGTATAGAKAFAALQGHAERHTCECCGGSKESRRRVETSNDGCNITRALQTPGCAQEEKWKQSTRIELRMQRKVERPLQGAKDNYTTPQQAARTQIASGSVAEW